MTSAAVALLSLAPAPGDARAQAAAGGAPTLAAPATVPSPAAREAWRDANAQVRLGFEPIRLPSDETMGLLGASYLVEVSSGVLFGPAVYGALTGQRGGLFVVGVELGWERAIAGSPMSVGAGVYAGGGGGSAAPVGDGLMLRPHADVWWNLGAASAGISWSQVRFVNGDIDSRQFGLVVRTRTLFHYAGRDQLGDLLSTSRRSGLGFDRVLVVAGAYLPHTPARNTGGGAPPSAIRLVGVRAEQESGAGTWWGVEAAGAASGAVAGYAEVLTSLGAERALGDGPFSLGGRAAIGMGGGGGVSVGGGFLVRGAVTGAARLTRDLALVLEGGLTAAPDGDFRATLLTVALDWTFDDRLRSADPVPLTRMEWFAGVEGYRAERKDRSVRDLQSIVLRVNRYVTPSVFVTGQVRSALGGGAGAYTVGLFGLGANVPIAGARLGGALHGGVELLAGAAGGGGVETGSGIVAQPMVFLGVDVGAGLTARLGAGRIKALSGPLDGTVVEASVGFVFGVPARAHR